MADELVEQMEELDIQSPSLFGLPTEVLQNIFNYLRTGQKQLAENAVIQSPEYNTFMNTPIAPYTPMSIQQRMIMINEAEQQFIANSAVNIPYQVALRYFRDLARRRGHNIN